MIDKKIGVAVYRIMPFCVVLLCFRPSPLLLSLSLGLFGVLGFGVFGLFQLFWIFRVSGVLELGVSSSFRFSRL